MTAQELQQKLREGIVEFAYTKKDGSTRNAKGTLNTELIDKFGATPKGTGTAKQNDEVLAYYDINAEGWRSFRKESLL